MRKIGLVAVLCLVINGLGIAQQSPTKKPQIALLGMFHFGGTTDVGAIKMPDLHSEKRQAEILNLVEQLKAYKPSKILLEYPYSRQDTLQKRYELFLEGNFELRDSETYQVGFRLAKALGHSKVYAIDHRMDLPFNQVAEYMTSENRMEEFNAMITQVQELMAQESRILKTMPLSSYLAKMNTPEFDAKANSLYLKETLNMGGPGNEVGAGVAATWYHRNMIMLKHIASCIESPGERLLVVVGNSHRAVIKDFVQDRLDMEYAEIARYLK